MGSVTLAAPAPKTGPALQIDKYLPDDVDGVLVINVKQIMSSPGYKKNFHKQLADLVARAEVQEYLKDIGFDPLKDIEQVVLCLSKSCFRTEGRNRDEGEGPFILFRGKFDSQKLKTKMEAIAKNHADKVSSIDAPGGQKIYRIDPHGGPFAAQLDAHTVVIAGVKAHVLDALQKAGGKKTTKFIHKEMPARLKKLDTDTAVQGFALEQMVMTTRYEPVDDGKGKRRMTEKHVTLSDKGFSGAVLRVTVKDDARGSVIWNIKDKTKAKALTQEFNRGLDEIRKEGRRAAERRPQMMPLVRFFDGASIKSTDQTMTMEGKADVDMIQALFQELFRGGL
jgi:hypothetical protein